MIAIFIPVYHPCNGKAPLILPAFFSQSESWLCMTERQALNIRASNSKGLTVISATGRQNKSPAQKWHSCVLTTLYNFNESSFPSMSQSQCPIKKTLTSTINLHHSCVCPPIAFAPRSTIFIKESMETETWWCARCN